MSGQNMDYSDIRIKALESERDSLREDRDAMEYRINELKAELEEIKNQPSSTCCYIHALELRKDRDAWKATAEEWKHRAEIRGSEACKIEKELDDYKKSYGKLAAEFVIPCKDCDHWKSKAEKLVEALRILNQRMEIINGTEDSGHCLIPGNCDNHKAMFIAKEALSAFEREKGE